MIMGEKSCWVGWKKILGITDCSFKKVKKYFNEGMKDIPFKYTSSRKSIKTNIARAWMNNYFKTTGEKMPMRMQILLPSFLTKTFIYDFFKSDPRHESDPLISYSGFCKLWKQEFSYVTIPAVSMELNIYQKKSTLLGTVDILCIFIQYSVIF